MGSHPGCIPWPDEHDLKNGAPRFWWINTVLGNLKTGRSGAYHAFKFRKYAQHYLSTMTYRFNRRFNLAT